MKCLSTFKLDHVPGVLVLELKMSMRLLKVLKALRTIPMDVLFDDDRDPCLKSQRGEGEGIARALSQTRNCATVLDVPDDSNPSPPVARVPHPRAYLSHWFDNAKKVGLRKVLNEIFFEMFVKTATVVKDEGIWKKFLDWQRTKLTDMRSERGSSLLSNPLNISDVESSWMLQSLLHDDYIALPNEEIARMTFDLPYCPMDGTIPEPFFRYARIQSLIKRIHVGVASSALPSATVRPLSLPAPSPANYQRLADYASPSNVGTPIVTASTVVSASPAAMFTPSPAPCVVPAPVSPAAQLHVRTGGLTEVTTYTFDIAVYESLASVGPKKVHAHLSYLDSSHRLQDITQAAKEMHTDMNTWKSVDAAIHPDYHRQRQSGFQTFEDYCPKVLQQSSIRDMLRERRSSKKANRTDRRLGNGRPAGTTSRASSQQHCAGFVAKRPYDPRLYAGLPSHEIPLPPSDDERGDARSSTLPLGSGSTLEWAVTQSCGGRRVETPWSSTSLVNEGLCNDDGNAAVDLSFQLSSSSGAAATHTRIINPHPGVDCADNTHGGVCGPRDGGLPQSLREGGGNRNESTSTVGGGVGARERPEWMRLSPASRSGFGAPSGQQRPEDLRQEGADVHRDGRQLWAECRQALHQRGTKTITRGVQRLHVDEGDEAAVEEAQGCDDVDGDDDCNSDDLPNIRPLGRKAMNGGATARKGPATKSRRSKKMDDDTSRSDGEGGRNLWSVGYTIALVRAKRDQDLYFVGMGTTFARMKMREWKWEDVRARLQSMGVTRDVVDCGKKWDNLMQQFKKMPAGAGAARDTMATDGGGEAADEQQGSTKDSTFSAGSGSGYGKRKNIRQQTFEVVAEVMDKHGALMASTMDSASKRQSSMMLHQCEILESEVEVQRKHYAAADEANRMMCSKRRPLTEAGSMSTRGGARGKKWENIPADIQGRERGRRHVSKAKRLRSEETSASLPLRRGRSWTAANEEEDDDVFTTEEEAAEDNAPGLRGNTLQRSSDHSGARRLVTPPPEAQQVRAHNTQKAKEVVVDIGGEDDEPLKSRRQRNATQAATATTVRILAPTKERPPQGGLPSTSSQPRPRNTAAEGGSMECGGGEGGQQEARVAGRGAIAAAAAGSSGNVGVVARAREEVPVVEWKATRGNNKGEREDEDPLLSRVRRGGMARDLADRARLWSGNRPRGFNVAFQYALESVATDIARVMWYGEEWSKVVSAAVCAQLIDLNMDLPLWFVGAHIEDRPEDDGMAAHQEATVICIAHAFLAAVQMGGIVDSGFISHDRLSRIVDCFRLLLAACMWLMHMAGDDPCSHYEAFYFAKLVEKPTLVASIHRAFDHRRSVIRAMNVVTERLGKANATLGESLKYIPDWASCGIVFGHDATITGPENAKRRDWLGSGPLEENDHDDGKEDA
ncbi:hypothetical protein CBR_g36879 [Chara braunii]|uniref:Myb/SANT-like DNA-binding domain-containing protein n=1 Tax=Chara braunii TaxID=69332 RepID=A0A388LLU0_CHABU|nr:hypothetical protein CBR_g36879 [Chara braunii]|eukprot:GBG83264.1 hypothetical protein CBR_g36879 [Chara braunii]